MPLHLEKDGKKDDAINRFTRLGGMELCIHTYCITSAYVTNPKLILLRATFWNIWGQYTGKTHFDTHQNVL